MCQNVIELDQKKTTFVRQEKTRKKDIFDEVMDIDDDDDDHSTDDDDHSTDDDDDDDDDRDTDDDEDCVYNDIDVDTDMDTDDSFDNNRDDNNCNVWSQLVCQLCLETLCLSRTPATKQQPVATTATTMFPTMKMLSATAMIATTTKHRRQQ